MAAKRDQSKEFAQAEKLGSWTERYSVECSADSKGAKFVLLMGWNLAEQRGRPKVVVQAEKMERWTENYSAQSSAGPKEAKMVLGVE